MSGIEITFKNQLNNLGNLQKVFLLKPPKQVVENSVSESQQIAKIVYVLSVASQILILGVSALIPLEPNSWMTDSAKACFLIAGVLTLITFLVASLATLKSNQVKFIFRIFLITIIVALITTHVALSYFTPLFSWDALDFWAPRALALSSGDISFFTSDHPFTLSKLLLFLGDASIRTQLPLPGLIWLVTLYNTGFLIFAFVAMSTEKVVLGAIALILFLTVPLPENHVAAFGYAELFILNLNAIAIVTIYFLLGQKFHLGYLLTMIAALILLGFSIKNTGPFYIALATVIGCAIKIGQSVPKNPLTPTYFLAGALALFIVLLAYFAEIGPATVISWRSYSLKVGTFMSVQEAVNSVIQIHFSNASFSILPAFSLITLTGLVSSQLHNRKADREYLVFLTYFCCSSTLVIFTLLHLDYGVATSTRGQDSSGSRLLLPIIALTPLLMARQYKRLGKQ